MHPRPDDISDEDLAWERWFRRWSLPLVEVTDEHLHAFLARARTESLDGTPRPASASSMQRLRATVRGALSNAMKRRLIEWDPWTAVDRPPNGSATTTASTRTWLWTLPRWRRSPPAAAKLSRSRAVCVGDGPVGVATE